MKFLNPDESARILQSLSETPDAGLELRVDFTECLDRSAPLARLLLAMLGEDQPSFLWIREFGIWPSLENWDLFNALRTASGIGNNSLADRPGHEFGSDELDRATSYLQLLLLNGWGGVFIGHKSLQRIAISHDSWLSIKPSTELSAQKSRLDKFGLPTRMEKAPQSLVAV